ncbi:energy-coupling factor transport system ATP-binding protein [Microbacterium sp. AG1240]|uniref:ABC transporter ATP-binding protein n=1 Tax=Microbacterium sp. AG1240 TaxID=2183992 RepID=UPI000EB3A533|nr:ABC transporter ATP-binding protein [Microbacterium sp. AG1240]RKT31840.1 energy-coupling factor transport system ATP-binding protein [Microbacterium sp. AG1240]
MTSVPLLRVRGVGITHDEASTATPADVTFDVSPGEVVLLLGPSGSGKSTLALALNGLIPHAVPATVVGTVRVGEADAATTPVAELSTRVGMVFQDPDAQLVTGTVLDEVAFGPENLRLPVDDVLARAETALRRVGLWHRRADNPDLLSGGGRQRLAIACALAMGSPLLVLDEPTANLDPRGIEEVYAALADLVAEGDRAIVLVEHNLDAAVGLVDRVVVIDARGHLVMDDTVDAVMRRRADELLDLGVWLPTSALAAMRLRRAGMTLDPLPLTPAELHAALEAEPAIEIGAIGGNRQAAAARAPIAADSTGSGGARQAPSTAASAPLVRVRGLTLTRGRTPVLHDVDLDIAAGEFIAIVGANGAGKTSLAQALAGVMRPPRGTVEVAGRDVHRTDARTLAASVGFVFQNPEHQFVANSVFDELAHALRMQRLPDDEVHRRVDDMLARFGLEHRAQAHPFLLSGGQKRRLSVGTALIGGARLLVLDEPTFGQDRARADELLSLLEGLHTEGATVVVVTHDMQLVTDYAERTVVVSDGRILAAAPTTAVFADDALIERAGLRPPPLRQALRGLTHHPSLSSVARIADLPGARG